jgi:hypothetical protein
VLIANLGIYASSVAWLKDYPLCGNIVYVCGPPAVQLSLLWWLTYLSIYPEVIWPFLKYWAGMYKDASGEVRQDASSAMPKPPYPYRLKWWTGWSRLMSFDSDVMLLSWVNCNRTAGLCCLVVI